jgi:hypothetical protein
MDHGPEFTRKARDALGARIRSTIELWRRDVHAHGDDEPQEKRISR